MRQLSRLIKFNKRCRELVFTVTFVCVQGLLHLLASARKELFALMIKVIKAGLSKKRVWCRR